MAIVVDVSIAAVWCFPDEQAAGAEGVALVQAGP